MGLLRCHQYDNSFFFFPFFSVFQGNNDGADGLLVCDRTCCNGPTMKKMARAHLVHSSTWIEGRMRFCFFSFIARKFSTSLLSIFQVQDDGADGTHGFAMVHSVIALSEDPSDLSWFSLGLRLLWFRVLHGSAALPPISSLFYSSVQFHDDGYEDTLGLTTVFFVVARAADAT